MTVMQLEECSRAIEELLLQNSEFCYVRTRWKTGIPCQFWLCDIVIFCAKHVEQMMTTLCSKWFITRWRSLNISLLALPFCRVWQKKSASISPFLWSEQEFKTFLFYDHNKTWINLRWNNFFFFCNVTHVLLSYWKPCIAIDILFLITVGKCICLTVVTGTIQTCSSWYRKMFSHNAY